MKAITMIVVLAVVVIEIAVAYYAIMMNKVSKETYMSVAKDVSGSVAQVVDKEDVKTLKTKVSAVVDASPTHPIMGEASDEELETYFAQFDALQSDTEYVAVFEKTQKFLRNFADESKEFVDCIYLVYVDPVNEIFVYIIDSAYEDACPPGCIDPIFEENRPVLSDPTIGFPPYITNTDVYGWLITAGSPIYDGDTVIGFAMADISMETVRHRQANSIIRLFIYMLVTLVLIGVAGVIWVSLWMIKPLKKLTDVAESYNSENPKETHDKFQKLENNTHDEIEDLTHSLKRMENDVYERYNDLLEAHHELTASREEAKKLEILANEDGLTGVHNKIAYNAEVERINKQIENGEKVNFAIVMIDLNYLKDTNDSYGHDTGDVALIKLAGFVSDIFKLSPVYRVGGDEFVVICRGKDFQKVANHVDELKRKISKSIKNTDVHDADHISAAVGYSTFNSKTDKVVDDVFKRADRAMYENKRELKKYMK